MAKEKRQVINATIPNAQQAWGGENNTSSTQTILGVEVPPGTKWAIDFAKVEEYLKGQLAAIGTDKVGDVRWQRPEGENFFYLLLFATKADAAAWDLDRTLTNYISRQQLPISAVQSDSYSARLYANITAGTKYKIKNGAGFSVGLRYSSLKFIAATGETENMNIRGTLTIERSVNNQQTFTTVATLESVIDSSDATAENFPYTLDLSPYMQDSRDSYFRIRASFVHDGTTEVSGTVIINVNSVSLDVERIGDWAQPVMASNGFFPMSYKVMGATERYLHVEISGTVATYTAVRPLAATEEYPETNPLTWAINESNSYGILTHGVHTVRVWLTCDDGSGHVGDDGYPDSIVGDVVENRLMVVNTNATGINAEYATPELLRRPRLILQHVETQLKNYVRTEILKYAVWNPDQTDPSQSSSNMIDMRLLLTNYGGTDTSYTKTYVDEDRTGTNGVVSGQQYTLDTTVEIEPEQGESQTSYIAYLRIFRYEGSTQVNFMQQSIGSRFIGITVDNSENYAPTPGAWFVMNPRTRSNADANRTQIVNAVDGSIIQTIGIESFGFINDGYITLPDGQKVLRVLAGQEIDLALDPFVDYIGTSSAAINAQMSFELIFSVRNITQEDEPMIDITQVIDDQQIGMRLTPLEGFINRVGAVNPTKPITDLTFAWEEEKRTHLMLTINPAVVTRGQDELPWMQTEGGAVSQPLPLAKVFVDGYPEREVDYPLSARIWATGAGKHIIIGNAHCDIDIYGIRIYRMALSAEQVVQNYVASLPTAEEKQSVKRKNAIVTSGRIDYEKALAAGYRCLTWVGQDQYKTNQDKNTGYAGYWRIRHDNPALAGTIGKAAYLAYMAGTIGNKKCLMITAQGSTANTYWENNGQTKLDKVTYMVNIPFSKLHYDFGWVPSKSTGANCANPMYLDGTRIEGTDYEALTDEEKALVTIDVVDGWFDGNGWSDTVSEMGMYHGAFYTSVVDGAKATKLVNKINYASPMQSHKMGATMLYNDVMKAVTGGMALHRNNPSVRFAVKEEKYLYFTENPMNDYKPEFHGMCTFGDGKFDKVVFGYKADSRTFAFEGLNNNLPLCDFRVPADADVIYDPAEESWVYNGVKSMEYGLGKTDGDDFPIERNDTIYRRYTNFIYGHCVSLRYYDGTRAAFNAEWDALMQDPQANAATIADMQNHQYWFTGDLTKVRYNYKTSEWVDAGTWDQSTLTYASGICDLSTDAMTAQAYEEWAASSSFGDYDVLNTAFRRAIARHAAANWESVASLANHLTHYNLVQFLLGGTDNCSKNDYYQADPDTGLIWLDQDDLDTILPTDNNGRNTKKYFIDRIHDLSDYIAGYKTHTDYEGSGSVLFNLIEAAFEEFGTELRENMRAVLTAMAALVGSTDSQEQSVMGCMEKYFLSTQEYFPQLAYAEQGRVRYEYPKSWGYISHGTQARSIDPITQQVGAQLAAERQFIKRRLAYVASYACWGGFSGGAHPGVIGTSLNADANLSLSPGQGNYGADYTFTVVPHQWLYPSGTNQGRDAVDPHVRVAPGEALTFSVGPASGDGAVGLNAINYFRKIGNLGNMTVTSVLNVSAKRLVEFIAEPSNPATSMFSPATLNLNAPNLNKLSLKGVSAIGGTQDYTALIRLSEMDLRGTTVRSVGVPQTTSLTTLHLPGTLTSVALMAQPALAELSVADASLIAEAFIGHIPSATAKALMAQIYAEQEASRVLDALTLRDIDWTDVNEAMMEWIAEIAMRDFTGRVVLASLTFNQYDNLVALYTQAVFTPGNSFIIDYTQPVIDGPTILKNGDTGQYRAAGFPVKASPVEFLLYDGDTLIEAQTDSQGRRYRTHAGVTLYEATGVVSIADEITSTVTLGIVAKSGTDMARMALTTGTHTYPMSVTIAGESKVWFETSGETHLYARTFNTDNFDAKILNVSWSLSETGIASLTANEELDDDGNYKKTGAATLTVTEASTTPITLTITCVVTFTGNRTVTSVKEIVVRNLPYGAVNLGLPSGLLWATGNIIKTDDVYSIGLPTNYGCYFSWGNIVGYNTNEIGTGDGEYSFSQENYDVSPGKSVTANIASNDAEHDAIVARLGNGWHLPTTDNFSELFNDEYTTNVWTTVNGVNGRLVTSKINGKSVFFPASGLYGGTSLNGRGSLGYVWSSRWGSTAHAYYLVFNSGFVNPASNYRYYGFALRAVQ